MDITVDSDQYRKEVEAALEGDNTRLGDVWRLNREGKSPDQISEELGVSTSGFVYTYRRYIDAILEGVLPDKPTLANQTAGVLRSFRKRYVDSFSLETKQVLKKRAEDCKRLATDVKAIEEEVAEDERQTSEVAKLLIPGIYVYTYPHYLHHPVVQENEDFDKRTYLKVGMSTKDAFERVMKQTTGMPEPAKILQVWIVDNDKVEETEKKIHDHLRVIGHRIGNNKRREWFLTNEETIDSTANLIGLTCHYDHRKQNTDK